MKEHRSLRLIETTTRKRLNRSEAGGSGNGAVSVRAPGVLPELKNATTLLYLSLDDLRNSLDKPAVCAKKIEELKGLTCRLHALIERLLEALP